MSDRRSIVGQDMDKNTASSFMTHGALNRSALLNRKSFTAFETPYWEILLYTVGLHLEPDTEHNDGR